MNNYYISLARGLQGYYVLVKADNIEVVRKYALSYYGKLWCSIYEDYDMSLFKVIHPKCNIINENDPIELGSSFKYENS